MDRRGLVTLICALVFCASVARGDTTSYTGTLTKPDNNAGTFGSNDSFRLEITLSSVSDVILQTYGFGGGVNAAGETIDPGGTDPFVGLFSGTGKNAVFLNGSSLDTNYSPGCPPANTVSDFGGTPCGDVTLTFDDLAAGKYTILLTDGQYIPCAAVDPSCTTLGDGAADFTGGQFCNIADETNGVETDCPNTSGAYALDVTVNSAAPPVPEPDSLLLLGTGLLGTVGCWRRRRR
ncbi:MAG TPA: DVUA0089 family protein [Candidatus Aquilonibacter sp.]|nr:DVUA0089 family protein [Candidatus Aquilonibacter sp.]